MANSFVTIQNIARQTLMRLMDTLVMPQLCYRDFSGTFTDMGSTIQVRKPTKLTANSYTRGSQVVSQDIEESTTLITLDQMATVNVKWDDIEGALNFSDQKLQTDVIEPASAALAEKINIDGLKVYSQIPGYVGTAGTTPDGLDDFAKMRLFLNTNKVPTANRVAVWDPEADAAFSQISGLQKVNEAGQNTALREGEIGRLYGFDNYMSQAVAKHTKGTLAATGSGAKILLNGAAAASMSVSLDTGGTALTGTLKAGDILTFGTGASAVVATVAEDATAADNAITVKLLSPVTAADNAEVTVGADYTANMAFHRNAIAFVNRPLPMPAGGAEGYVVTDPYSGLSLRVVRGYDMSYKTNMMSIDILYAYKCVYPEMAVRVLG